MKRILLPSNKDDTISLPPYVDFRAEDNRVAPWEGPAEDEPLPDAAQGLLLKLNR
jgi:hypothetical protein